MRQTVAISLPEDLATELDALAAREGASRSDIVREALRRHLATRALQQLREAILPFAEAQGVFTDEDLFRITS